MSRFVDPYLLPLDPIGSVEEYLATEWGGKGIERAVALGPEATIAEIRAAGLRGRGGGGFPTATKWAGVRGQPGTRRYVVVNGAEGEPGTFKDRAIMRANPYQVVEGLVIAAFVIGASESFLAVKASFEREADLLTRAVQELQSAGICQDCTVTIVRGPDDYLFGEEKALLEVIEGRPAMPRLLPPYEHGLFAGGPEQSHPTLVNNVETLANVTPILARGAEWYRGRGTEASPGHVVATIVGDVVHPAVGEIELGTPLREVIDSVGGGVRPGRAIKAVFSGVANAVLTAEHLDVPVAYETMADAGSGMGAAGFIVYDDTTCMVEVARVFSRFLAAESCGQCPPCKLGSSEITAALDAIDMGTMDNRTLDRLRDWLTKVTDANRCYLGREEQLVVLSILNAFGDEVDQHVGTGACPRPRGLTVPTITDL